MSEDNDVERVLGYLLIDAFNMLQRADDNHIHSKLKFKNRAYHAGYTDALRELTEKIRKYSEGDK